MRESIRSSRRAANGSGEHKKIEEGSKGFRRAYEGRRKQHRVKERIRRSRKEAQGSGCIKTTRRAVQGSGEHKKFEESSTGFRRA